jgi:hypothetical protein
MDRWLTRFERVTDNFFRQLRYRRDAQIDLHYPARLRFDAQFVQLAPRCARRARRRENPVNSPV